MLWGCARWFFYGAVILIFFVMGDLFLAALVLAIAIFHHVTSNSRQAKRAREEPFYGSQEEQTVGDQQFEIFRQTYFFQLFGCLCKADGVVTRDEINGVNALFSHLHFSEAQITEAKESFRVGKSLDFDLEESLDEIDWMRIALPTAINLLHLLNVVVANADGSGLVQAERELLYRIGESYGLNAQTIAQVLMWDEGSRQTGTGNDPRESSVSALERAYERLELKPDATLRQATRSYQRLRSRYHPDKLPYTASEEQRDEAEKNFNDVQKAWDIVRVHFNA